MEKKRQTLSVDLDSLFPGTTITIGKDVIFIKPLGIEHISEISKKLECVLDILKEEGVTSKNFNTPENIFKIATILLANSPDILEEAANLDIAIIKKLPIGILVEIVDKIVEVNLDSKEAFEKNFKSLINKFFPAEVKKKTTLKKIKK